MHTRDITELTIGTGLGCDVVVNATNFSSKVAAAIGKGNKRIYFRNGSYSITSPISLNNVENVEFIGESHKVKFSIPFANLPSFSFNFMFTGVGNNIVFRNLHLDGLYRTYTITQPIQAAGGGINMGQRYVIDNCIIEDFNYFGIWVNSATQDSIISNNIFRGPGGGRDHIGGGITDLVTPPENIKIFNNVWESNIAGNAFNNTGGRHFWIHHNYNYSDRSFYLEAMHDMHVHNNYMKGGNIVCSSDKQYHSGNIGNSKNVYIHDNEVSHGGAIQYYVANDTVRNSSVGGNVNIYNNIIMDSQYYGILVNGDGFDSSKWGMLVNIQNNTIINPNSSAVATLNIGTGVIIPTGINVPQGNWIKINNNMIIDNRTVPTITHAVQVGHQTASGFDTVARNIYVHDNITNVANQLQLSGGVTNSYVR